MTPSVIRWTQALNTGRKKVTHTDVTCECFPAGALTSAGSGGLVVRQRGGVEDQPLCWNRFWLVLSHWPCTFRPRLPAHDILPESSWFGWKWGWVTASERTSNTRKHRKHRKHGVMHCAVIDVCLLLSFDTNWCKILGFWLKKTNNQSIFKCAQAQTIFDTKYRIFLQFVYFDTILSQAGADCGFVF